MSDSESAKTNTCGMGRELRPICSQIKAKNVDVARRTLRAADPKRLEEALRCLADIGSARRVQKAHKAVERIQCRLNSFFR